MLLEVLIGMWGSTCINGGAPEAAHCHTEYLPFVAAGEGALAFPPSKVLTSALQHSQVSMHYYKLC